MIAEPVVLAAGADVVGVAWRLGYVAVAGLVELEVGLPEDVVGI